MKVVVTGSVGSGKTYVAEYCRKQGLPVFDADIIPGLCTWTTEGGKPAQPPAGAKGEWYEKHLFLWDEPVLTKLLEEHSTIYVFGSADNMFTLSHYFDYKFFLDVPKEVLIDRLQSKQRQNPYQFGADESHIRTALSWLSFYTDNIEKNGFLSLDGTKTPKEILADITRYIG